MASAQQVLNGVEILVNDRPISTYDIDQRLRLVVAVAGGINNQEELVKVRDQVTKTMIDELLQLLEAEELEASANNDQLEDYFARRAQGMGQTAEQLENALKGIGSSKATMMRQMKAEILWGQIVQGKMGMFVSVSDEEVEDYIQRLRDNKGKFEYRLAEITLSVNDNSQDASVKATAEGLLERLRSGASFPDVARQLSSSSSAAVGGDLGWLSETEIDPDLAKTLSLMDVGQLTSPIRTPSGYRILANIDRRKILSADPLDTQVSLRQIHLTKEKIEDATAVAAFEKSVKIVASNSGNLCGRVSQFATDAGADPKVEIGNLRLRDISPAVRNAVKALEVGRPSELIKMDDGMRILFVCGREEAKVQEPDFDMIYSQIENQRMSMMGRRYLRDLHRDAIIDYR